MGADHHLDGSIRQAAQQPRPLAPLDRAGEQRHRHRREMRQGAVVLAGEHLGGRHQRRLGAGFHRAQHGQQRHQRLAGPDVALQQPQHAAGAAEVGVDLRQRACLRRRGGEAEAFQRLGAQRAVARQDAARAGAHPAAHHAQRHLSGQQLVIREADAGPVGRRFCRGLDRAQGVGEGGPFLAAEQGRIVPFGQGGQAGQRFPHGGAHLARPQAGGEAPYRLDRRQPVGHGESAAHAPDAEG